jgi:hypothetical protein
MMWGLLLLLLPPLPPPPPLLLLLLLMMMNTLWHLMVLAVLVLAVFQHCHWT